MINKTLAGLILCVLNEEGGAKEILDDWRMENDVDGKLVEGVVKETWNLWCDDPKKPYNTNLITSRVRNYISGEMNAPSWRSFECLVRVCEKAAGCKYAGKVINPVIPEAQEIHS